MARGKPFLWGSLLAVPCLLVGAGIRIGTLSAPQGTAIPLILLGVFGPACGLYVRWAAPERRELETVAEFAPSHVPAYVLAAISLVLLAAVLYLLLGTELPYVYPGVAFLLFLATFLKALVGYWRSSLTTYYVADREIVSEYRFLGLSRTSLEHEDVTDISRRQTVLDTLLGLGTVEVVVPSGRITLDNLRDPDEAERLLNRLRRGR